MLLAQAILNQDSLITVGSALVVVASVASAVWWLAGKINAFDNRLERMERDRAESWTRKDQKIFVLELRLHNPTLKVNHEDVNATGG